MISFGDLNDLFHGVFFSFFGFWLTIFEIQIFEWKMNDGGILFFEPVVSGKSFDVNDQIFGKLRNYEFLVFSWCCLRYF